MDEEKMTENNEHLRVLIEEWFPFEEVGIECRRERGMSSALPPINYLHVWWARRPLTVSKAAILASLLPRDTGKKDFHKIMGYSPTIIEEYNRISEAKKQKIRLKKGKGYTQDRCFNVTYTSTSIQQIKKLIERNWGKSNLNVLDPMAGGGSIPFEATKLGMNVYSSDLNPVAVILLNSTIKYPLEFGESLISKIQNYANEILKNASNLLKYFPITHEKEFDAFLWVRTTKCPNPECNLEVPLSPNWDLSQNPKIILQPIPPENFSNVICKFNVIKNPTDAQSKANTGTVSNGIGLCPRCKTSLSREYIKNEAQADRMGHQLMAVAYKEPIGSKKFVRKYRAPNESDQNAIANVDAIIRKKIEEWSAQGFLPEENIEVGEKTREMLNKGIDKWYKLFNNRQLLANTTILKEIIELRNNLLKNPAKNLEESKAIITYLQLAFDKMIDRNAIQTRWVPSYERIANTFDRHDFAFKWSYAEMDIIRKGFDWAVENVLKSYKGLVELFGAANPNYQINCSAAQNLEYIKDNSVDVVVIDPPYYNNVMYAELSDFFYVWMKKGIGDLYPEFFTTELTDKDNEAVANSSKFEGMGKSKKELAKQDYEAKMRASFTEMFRLLQLHGVLTVMFTHKKTDAWDTLAMSLMEAGFEITASWPVHTESEISLHIAKKNAVKTTILLVCRKRLKKIEDVWWEDDVLPVIKKVVREKTKEFQKLGINGVDLFISAFGPALREFSRYYPVKNIEGEEIRPEEALKVARKIVTDIILRKVIEGKTIYIDPASKFYLLAWYFYKARRFPFDEARQLALSIGVNIDDLKMQNKILEKKSSDVEILSPTHREKNGILDLDNPQDDGLVVNAIHLAMLAYQKGGHKSYKNVVKKLRRDADQSFRQYMEALYAVLPDVTNLEEKKMLGELMVSTKERIIAKGGKITDPLYY